MSLLLLYGLGRGGERWVNESRHCAIPKTAAVEMRKEKTISSKGRQRNAAHNSGSEDSFPRVLCLLSSGELAYYDDNEQENGGGDDDGTYYDF